MRRSWQLETSVKASVWACAGLIAAIVSPQPGKAQTPTAESNLETIASSTLVVGVGAVQGGVGSNYNPIARTETDEEPILRGFWYSGYDGVRGDNYFFTEAVVALNGDLSRNGVVLRTYGSRVNYELEPGKGRGYQADLMLGYRVSGAKMDSTFYVGGDYQNYSNDPTAEVRGTEWGFKVVADLEGHRIEGPIYYALVGEYSTAFQSYWARGRVGMTLRGTTFGPEAVALGDVGFDAQRIGGFAMFDLKLLPQWTPLEVSLHVGHQFVSRNDGGGPGGSEGTYGGISIGILF